ncbi:MAG: hypothetical protein NW207_11360 [Cytophagales bacterium]|nr:hypothetical protein [Cytophagales bacterium]
MKTGVERVIRVGVFVALFSSLILNSHDINAQNGSADQPYIYVRPSHFLSIDDEGLVEVSYVKVYVNDELVLATSEKQIYRNYIALDTYNHWKEAKEKEVKVVFTLFSGIEMSYKIVKDNEELISQSSYFIN